MDVYIELLESAAPEGVPGIIKSAIDDINIFYFNRLLEEPKVQMLAQSKDQCVYFKLLELFAYGTWSDYKEIMSELPELKPNQKEKLKYLTLVSYASERKILEYDELIKGLDCSDEQEMEDLVIESTYKGLIIANLDQQRRVVEIDYVVGRDVKRCELTKINDMLVAWSSVCSTAISEISSRISDISSAAAQKLNMDLDFNKSLEAARSKYASRGLRDVRHGNASDDNSGDDDSSNSDSNDRSKFNSPEYKREEKRQASTTS